MLHCVPPFTPEDTGYTPAGDEAGVDRLSSFEFRPSTGTFGEPSFIM